MTSRAEQVVHDAVVVGSGFGGLYALHRLRTAGLSVAGIEGASDVGGTWFWNRYPGARCDTESLDYSYSFSPELEQEWTWSERYATQPEILTYLAHVADRFDLRPLIRFRTRVVSAEWDDATSVWQVRLDTGDVESARFLVLATGVLSTLKQVDLPGLADFDGTVLHTARWPAEGVDLAGRRVALLGTGSSGIQATPWLAEAAEHLHVLQRTPNFSVPARNRPLTEEEVERTKARYADRRYAARTSRAGMLELAPEGSALALDEAERTRHYEARWQLGGGPPFLRTFDDLGTDAVANETAAEFVRGKIREIVQDPSIAAALSPHGYPIGTKRICVDTDYYASFNRPDVTLVDLRVEPLGRVDPAGLVVGERHLDVDVIVLATGFDAISGAILDIDVRGVGGRPLEEHWAAGPRTVLGLMADGFPNMFTITGPGSPSVLGNVVTSIEQHVDWMADLLAEVDRRGASAVSATPDAEDWWASESAAAAEGTLLARSVSWYSGANIPGKPRALLPYPGGVGRFREICDQVATEGYRQFDFTTAPARTASPVNHPCTASPAHHQRSST